MYRFLLFESVKFLFFFLLIGNSVVSANERQSFETPKMLNNYGMPGSIDNPTAESFPEGQFSVSSTIFGGTIRTNLSFQITDKLTTSFRYSRIPSSVGDHGGYFWDRSFDVHYLIRRQTLYLPSIAVGLRDFIGTGLYSGEYIVATSSLHPRIKASAGIGWGRLSGKNNFSNVFGNGIDRNKVYVGKGGTFHIERFFSGDNSLFFSLSYNANPKLEVIAELSSDDYETEISTPKGFERKNDINIALKYKLASDFSIMTTLMHGNALGISGILTLNPRNSPYNSGIEPAPMPLLNNKIILETQKFMDPSIFDRTAKLLILDGIELLDLKIKKKGVLEVVILDRTYADPAQMIGRASRILSKTAPIQAKMFKIRLVDFQSGLEIAEIIIEREALRDNELTFDGPERLWGTVKVNNSGANINHSLHLSKNNLLWSFYPDVELMLFDPHSPINGSIGWNARLNYRLRNSTIISSSIKQPILTALDDIKRGPKTGLPNVRSDYMYYYRDIGIKPYISNLTLDQYFKPFKSIYSQLNFGYLEMMYFGVRSEIIWKDNKKPYGLGLDLTAVKKRSTYGDFSILNANYSTIIGTLYYDLGTDWNFKLDAGKYLAGDYGATLSLFRKFNNGWEIGAFATLTNVKFSTFGEGSFDKGLTLKAPLSWFTGKKSRAYRNTIIKPISGDGGARLYLEDDKFLYENIKIYGEKSFKDNWKRVYR